MKIIFTTPELEHPPKGGPRLRVESSIKALALIADVVLVSRLTLEKIGGVKATEFYKKYCSEIYFITDNSCSIVADKLAKIAFSEHADLIWMSFGNISYDIRHQMIKQRCPYPVVIDTDSVWSRFVLGGISNAAELQIKLGIFVQGVLKRWEESWGTALSHVTTAVSSVDARYYRLFNSEPYAVDIFSNVIDPDNYKEDWSDASIARPCLYLAGTFWPGSPMEQAALWLIEEILPLVRQKCPNIHTFIVGAGVTARIKTLADKKITITGRVESVLPYLKNADIALVPLKFESGTRFKIMEAGICSIPVVSTSLGAEGIPVTHGSNILIADNAQDFACAIIQLLNNPDMARKIGANCKKLIEEKNIISSAASEAHRIIGNLAKPAFRLVYTMEEALDTIASRVYSAIRHQDAQKMFDYAVILFEAMIARFGHSEPFLLNEEKRRIVELLENICPMVSKNENIKNVLKILST